MDFALGIGCVPNPTLNVSSGGSAAPSPECHEPLSIFVIEVLCVLWFTIDYCVRLIAAPNKCKFFKSVLNTIDLIAIVLFYISMVLETFFMGQIVDGAQPTMFEVLSNGYAKDMRHVYYGGRIADGLNPHNFQAP